MGDVLAQVVQGHGHPQHAPGGRGHGGVGHVCAQGAAGAQGKARLAHKGGVDFGAIGVVVQARHRLCAGGRVGQHLPRGEGQAFLGHVQDARQLGQTCRFWPQLGQQGGGQGRFTQQALPRGLQLALLKPRTARKHGYARYHQGHGQHAAKNARSERKHVFHRGIRLLCPATFRHRGRGQRRGA